MKIPKGQTLWVTYRNEKGRVNWAITSDLPRTIYILWKVDGDAMTKFKTAKSPKDFGEIAKRN